MSTDFGKRTDTGERGRRKKLIGWAEWRDEYLPRCPACKLLYAARTPPESPPCSQCRVDLIPENEEAGVIYMMCRRQLITISGMKANVLDISIPAVKAVMDAKGIIDQWPCLTKVITAFRTHDLPKLQGGES